MVVSEIQTQNSEQGQMIVRSSRSLKKVAVVGFGTVGTGVVGKLIQGLTGVELTKVVVRHPGKRRQLSINSSYITTDYREVINDPEIDVIIELTTDARGARKLALEALRNGKDFVTSNKQLIADYGHEIFELALREKRYVGFRGTFVGCHFLIHELGLARLLGEQRVKNVYAILNGTCNYILSSMTNGMSFESALAEAQAKGYAELDPSDDIDGWDTARKVRILLRIIHNSMLLPGKFPVTGIRDITIQDIEYAKELGYRVKLLGVIQRRDSYNYVSVHPALVPKNSLLGSIEGEYNGIRVESEDGIEWGLVAPGAGKDATASAVIKDLIDIANGIPPLTPNGESAIVIGNGVETISRWYLRVGVLDQPGVLAKISGIFAKHGISISAVLQKEATSIDFVPIVLTTHEANERRLRAAVKRIDSLSVVKAKTKVIQILDA